MPGTALELTTIDYEIDRYNDLSKRAVDRRDFAGAATYKENVATLLRRRGDIMYAVNVAEAQAAYFMAGAVESAARELEKKVR